MKGNKYDVYLVARLKMKKRWKEGVKREKRRRVSLNVVGKQEGKKIDCRDEEKTMRRVCEETGGAKEVIIFSYK